MEVSTEILQRFVGGQMEIQNSKEHYLYRGEIRTIEIVPEQIPEGEKNDLRKLTVTFNWLAKMDGDWVNHDDLNYAASLLLYSFSEVGNRVIMMGSWIIGERCTLFPPDDTKLDPAKVKGLAAVNN